MTSPLATLFAELIEASRLSKKAFADHVALGAATVSRILSGDERYSLSVEACLRVAQQCGVSASRVLRAAGKGGVADQLESLFGPAAVRRQQFAAGRVITIQEERHLARWRSLDAKSIRALSVLIEHVATDNHVLVRPRPRVARRKV